MSEKQMKSGNTYAWFIALVCLAVYGLGSGVMFSTFGLYIGDVMQNLGCSAAQASLGITLRTFVAAASLPLFWSKLWRTGKNTKWLMIAGAVIMVATYWGITSAKSLTMYYVFQCLQGISTPMIIHLPTATLITNWFKKSRATVMSIVMASAGIFSAIATPIVTNLINTQGWRVAYRIQATTVGVILIVLELLFVVFQPSDKNMYPYGFDPNAPVQSASQAAVAGVPAAEAKKTLDFKLIGLFLAAGMMATAIITYGKVGVIELYGDPDLATKVTSAVFAGQGVGGLSSVSSLISSVSRNRSWLSAALVLFPTS